MYGAIRFEDFAHSQLSIGGGGGGGEICSKKYKADEEKITTKKRYVTGFQMVALYC